MLSRKKTRISKRTQIIVKEIYNGKLNLTDILANIILDELGNNSKNLWKTDQASDIIKQTDNSQICLFKR